MERIVLGDVTVTRIGEYAGSVKMSPETFFPDSPENAWSRHRSWLEPEFFDAAANDCRTALQTWVLRTPDTTVLIDTGAGNHKRRPDTPLWDGLQTRFLDDLVDAGIPPDEVDVVVNTHLHADHVGWNTRLDGDDWVPTFPNATYLVPEQEYHRWNPDGHHYTGGNANVFEDSVAPVHQAGLMELWDGEYRIDPTVRLTSAPGHTPGSAVVTVESGTDRAVFVGDLLHTPLQFVEPDLNSCFCEDQQQARASRRAVLGWAAEHRALVMPAHLGGAGGAEVTRDGEKFAIARWAPFSCS